MFRVLSCLSTEHDRRLLRRRAAQGLFESNEMPTMLTFPFDAVTLMVVVLSFRKKCRSRDARSQAAPWCDRALRHPLESCR